MGETLENGSDLKTSSTEKTAQVVRDGIGLDESGRGAEEKFCSQLLYKMHLTRGARFQSARRHKNRSNASIWSIIALSVYVFSTNVFLALKSQGFSENFLLFLIILNIVMSAFIIAFSVLEHGKKHDLKAELFLRCAQGIGVLHDRIKFELDTGKINRPRIEKAVQDYSMLVNEFSENHSETDFRTFRINIGKHKDQPMYRWGHKLKYTIDCWSLMWISIVVPPAAVIYAFLAL